MKINEKMLSIPPYISTSWSGISAIHTKGNTLLINLVEGDTISIPDLKPEIIDLIFKVHARYLEQWGEGGEAFSFLQQQNSEELPEKGQSFRQEEIGIPFKIGFGAFDNMGMAMQHNPEQSQMPDLPKDVLNKISSIARIVAPPDEAAAIPKAEPHCNCIYCQIARAIEDGMNNSIDISASGSVAGKGFKGQTHSTSEKVLLEEEVKDEELQFQQWEIIKDGEKLYTVINRLDKNEKYSVFLGNPVGCTCGKNGCEHLLAILRSSY